MVATYPASERITTGLRHAIRRASEGLAYYDSRAAIARYLGNPARQREMRAAACRYNRALDRLENLAAALQVADFEACGCGMAGCPC